MNILINYADEHFLKAQRWNSRTGRRLGKFDRIYEFHPEDIDIDFKKAHADIFAYKRGNGLWLWKPYFIEKVINNCQDGDYVFYFDSGSLFVRDPRILISYMNDDQPIFVCDIPLIESNWTKPECFDALDAWEYKDYNQIQGGMQIVLVNDFTRKFYKEWLSLCSDIKLISSSGVGKFEGVHKRYGYEFVSHREDQSIFSLLCHKYGVQPHRDFSQRGRNPQSFYNPNYAYKVPLHIEDKYKMIVFLHKSPDLSIRFWLSYLKSELKRRIKRIESPIKDDVCSKSLEKLQQQVYCNCPNYLIEYTDDKKDCCVIYFTSNDLFAPHTSEMFETNVIIQNRFEWYRTRVNEGDKHIFVRDIYKQWYASGINCKINDVNALVEFLRSESAGYKKIITLGSSAGGYASVLFGTLLKADICFSFNGQWTLFENIERYGHVVSPILHSMLEKKADGVAFFNIADNTFDNPNVYYFVSDESPIDSKQLTIAGQLHEIHIVHFNTSHHGIPFLKNALPYIINLDKGGLNQLSMTKHSYFGFAIKYDGVFNSLKTVCFSLCPKLGKKK